MSSQDDLATLGEMAAVGSRSNGVMAGGRHRASPNGAPQQARSVVAGSSTTMRRNATVSPRVLQRFADISDNEMVGDVPTLAGEAQPAQNTDAGSSTNDDALPPSTGGDLEGEAQATGHTSAGNGATSNYPGDEVFGSFLAAHNRTLEPVVAGSSTTPMTGAAQDNVAFPATLPGPAQQLGQMGVDNTVNNFAAPDAAPSGYAPPPTQMDASSSVNNLAAPAVALTGDYAPPQMQMGADNSTNNTFAAEQQYSVANNATLNGGQQQFIAATRPANMYSQQQQQQLALSGTAPAHMGQNSQAAAPQFAAAPIAAARIRRHQEHVNESRKRRRTGPGPTDHALAGPAPTPAPAPQQAAAPQHVPVLQQVPVQEGPHAYTAAGVPNRDPNRPGNRQGQTAGWGQARKHHNSRCNQFVLDGCVPDCLLRVSWPLTWADWNSRRFEIRWEMVRAGRPQTEIVSGFAVAAQELSQEAFVVNGEVRPDGSINKSSKKVVRKDAAVKRGAE